jgi:hypothetical protein
MEFVETRKVEYQYLGFVPTNAQALVKVLAVG